MKLEFLGWSGVWHPSLELAVKNHCRERAPGSHTVSSEDCQLLEDTLRGTCQPNGHNNPTHMMSKRSLWGMQVYRQDALSSPGRGRAPRPDSFPKSRRELPEKSLTTTCKRRAEHSMPWWNIFLVTWPACPLQGHRSAERRPEGKWTIWVNRRVGAAPQWVCKMDLTCACQPQSWCCQRLTGLPRAKCKEMCPSEWPISVELQAGVKKCWILQVSAWRDG